MSSHHDLSDGYSQFVQTYDTVNEVFTSSDLQACSGPAQVPLILVTQ